MHQVNSSFLKFFHVLFIFNESSVDADMRSAPFRWKQYDAYVQVLEAKYADLCCECNANRLLYNVVFFLYQCAETSLAVCTGLNGF